MYYIYMLRCEDNSIYTGITTDVSRRFEEHSGRTPGKCARYTQSHRAIKIEAVWESETRESASRLEYYLKKLTKDKKERLIEDNSFFERFLKDKLEAEEYSRSDCSQYG